MAETRSADRAESTSRSRVEKARGKHVRRLLLCALAVQLGCTKTPADPLGVGEQPDTAKSQGMPDKPGTVPPAPAAVNEPSATVDDRDVLGTTQPPAPNDRAAAGTKSGNAAAATTRACDPAANADCDKSGRTAQAK